jgi:NAD(P)-dependent dehydrogenase (short-subunit alcohol dehydrogenase family)
MPAPDFSPNAQKRVTLVTGAARRIGRSIAWALSREGYAIAVHYGRSRAEAEDLVARIVSAGGQADAFQADLADPDSVAALIPSVQSAMGPLSLLVNSASQFEPDHIGGMSVPLWNRHFSINLRAPVFLAEAFAAQVGSLSDPSIVNIIDQRALKPTPGFTSYQLTKSALLTATVTLAQTLAPRIRVNGVAPGPTLGNTRQSQADFARQAAAVPLEHGPEPEEIADAVVFLAKARSITGQTIAVDGGQHIAWRTPDVDGIAE